MKQPLSPAANAVWEAFNETADRVGVFEDYGDALAAALRAVADQVVPEDPCGDDCCITRCEQIRADFLAIAAELEGTSPRPA
jgi:hypothetical protein